MVNPLSVVSNGYLYPYAKYTQSIAVDGYLIETVTPVHPKKQKKELERLIMYREEMRRYAFLKRDDEEILLIIKSFVICNN